MNLYNKYKTIIDNYISNNIHNINYYKIKDPFISIVFYSLLENKNINKNKIIEISLLFECLINIIKEYSINKINNIEYLQNINKSNQNIINDYSDIIKNLHNDKHYNGFKIINNTFSLLNEYIYKSHINLVNSYQTIFEMIFLLIWNLIDNNIMNMNVYKCSGSYLGVLYKIYIDIDEKDNLDIDLNMFKFTEAKELMYYYMQYQEKLLMNIINIDIIKNNKIIDELLNHLSNNISLIS